MIKMVCCVVIFCDGAPDPPPILDLTILCRDVRAHCVHIAFSVRDMVAQTFVYSVFSKWGKEASLSERNSIFSLR